MRRRSPHGLRARRPPPSLRAAAKRLSRKRPRRALPTTTTRRGRRDGRVAPQPDRPVRVIARLAGPQHLDLQVPAQRASLARVKRPSQHPNGAHLRARQPGLGRHPVGQPGLVLVEGQKIRAARWAIAPRAYRRHRGFARGNAAARARARVHSRLRTLAASTHLGFVVS